MSGLPQDSLAHIRSEPPPPFAIPLQGRRCRRVHGGERTSLLRSDL